MPPEALSASRAYLLDTTHCSDLLKGEPSVRSRLEQLSDARISTTVISRGELTFMAENSKRVEQNLSSARALLRGMEVIEIDHDIADVYGRIKAALCRHFAPRDSQKSERYDVRKLGISDNDLWIAAVALRYGHTLVSADSDFQRIKQVIGLEVEQWRPPQAGGAGSGPD